VDLLQSTVHPPTSTLHCASSPYRCGPLTSLVPVIVSRRLAREGVKHCGRHYPTSQSPCVAALRRAMTQRLSRWSIFVLCPIAFAAEAPPERQSTISRALDMSSFSWKDLNVTGSACGATKCFFPSTRETEVGYLIGPKAGGFLEAAGSVWHELQYRGWEITKQIEATARFGIRHFNMGPPELRSLANFEDPTFYRTMKIVPKSFMGKNLTVQMLRASPTPNFVLKRAPVWSNNNKTFSTAVDFLTKTSTDGTIFLNRFKSGLNASFNMAHHEPCLLWDWQVLLDHTGAVYQIDMDRCFCDWHESEAYRKVKCKHRPDVGALNATGVHKRFIAGNNNHTHERDQRHRKAYNAAGRFLGVAASVLGKGTVAKPSWLMVSTGWSWSGEKKTSAVSCWIEIGGGACAAFPSMPNHLWFNDQSQGHRQGHTCASRAECWQRDCGPGALVRYSLERPSS